VFGRICLNMTERQYVARLFEVRGFDPKLQMRRFKSYSATHTRLPSNSFKDFFNATFSGAESFLTMRERRAERAESMR
jgi:hypothetical protein